MAEEESELELDRFKEELENLLNAGFGDERGLQSKFYCAKFCELVEEYTGRWQVPLPQLQVLRSALCAFVRGAASFPSDCEHVRYTLSSLALSVFELLLFFGRDEFPEDPLKDILDSFQECQSSLVRYQNVYLLQVKHVIRDGGPWASPILDGILKELEQPHEEDLVPTPVNAGTQEPVVRQKTDTSENTYVAMLSDFARCIFAILQRAVLPYCGYKGVTHFTAPEEGYQQEWLSRYLSSEVSLFFELRVRYLLACERVREAMALAQRCSQHSAAGRHLYFKQAYLSCLWKSSLHDRLFTEMAEIDGKDAVEILCIAENEEKDEFLLELSRGFLWQQLRSGDMYHLWDLVFIWCKLYLRVKGSRDFLQECKKLILSATNVKAVFPFVKVILTEQLGKGGLIFCVELCAQALQTDLKNDPVTKCLLYKTVAYLFPNDLEICRACALLVFFLERTVEAYKTVFLLYNHPDQEYHLDSGPVGNSVRFEVIQILKKGLFFDPEFWNLLNLKTNCLKLMSDEVARAALCEIMEEDKWVPNYCAQGRCMCHPEVERTTVKQEAKPASSQSGTLVQQGRPLSGDEQSEPNLCKSSRRRRGSQIANDLEYFPVRRSFRQLDLAQNHARPRNTRYQRFHPRQVDMSILKRRGRRPRWLVEQLAAQAEDLAASQEKRPGRTPKLLDLQTGILDDTPVIEITMEYSYPDNEVELPDSVQGLSISKVTSTEAKTQSQVTSAPRDDASSALLQDLLEDSTHSWREKVTEGVQLSEVIAIVRTFHSYATVSEDELKPPDAPMDGVVKTTPTLEDELSLDLHVPVRNLGEPMKVYTVKNKMTVQTAPITKQTSAPLEPASEADILETHPSSELPSGQPVDQERVVNTLENGTVHQPRDKTACSMTDAIQDQKPETTVASISAIVSSPDKSTDRASTSESPTSDTVPMPAPELVPQRTPDVSACERVPAAAGEVTDVSANVSTVESSPKLTAKASLEEAPLQDQVGKRTTTQDRPSLITSSSCVPDPQPVVQLVHRCRLCSEECTESSVLNHALWHYRTEKNCMFCSTFTCTSGALCHFQKHIQDLETIDRPLETEKPEYLTVAEKPDQTVPKAPQKKPMPGLAQIKSKLLMRLKLNSKASTRQETKKSSDANGKPLEVENLTKEAPSEEPEQSEKKNDQESNLKAKIRYMTRGSVRRTEHKGCFLRKTLSRKAKTRAMKDGKKSLPKDGSGHRANGVIRKKRKVNLKEIGHVRRVREEKSKEQTESDEASSCVKTKQQAAETNTVEVRSLNCSKGTASQKPDVKKKKRKAPEQKDAVKDVNVDEKEVKKRKLSARPNGAGQKRTAGGANEQNVGLTTTTKQENGATTATNENLKPALRKVRGAYTVIRCPVETCVFQARANALLSHALIHHPGDRKTLEFFYNLAQKKNCMFCCRRIWNLEHFLDHIVSHRGNFKHPCYHADCTERFKTRLSLMEHMLKEHQPLKAVCSFADCTLQFHCLKTLYHHERGHYRKTFSPALRTEEGLEEADPRVATPKTTGTSPHQTPKSTDTAPSGEGTEKQGSVTPVKKGEKPLLLNRSSVNYSNKSPRLVNGHTDHEKEPRNKATPKRAKEDPKGPPVSVKPFVRPPPSSYLDELFLSMPKRWKEPHISPKGSVASIDGTANRQRCSRCSAAFESEEELKLHRQKCTSLFGFDSDDENAL